MFYSHIYLHPWSLFLNVFHEIYIFLKSHMCSLFASFSCLTLTPLTSHMLPTLCQIHDHFLFIIVTFIQMREGERGEREKER